MLPSRRRNCAAERAGLGRGIFGHYDSLRGTSWEYLGLSTTSAWQASAPFDVYADTDWAGRPATRRSTSGGCALRGTLSSGEAELVGGVKAASEGLGLQSIGRDLGLATQ
eukprot:1993731-Alexandrium_andersonii.AAC.1